MQFRLLVLIALVSFVIYSKHLAVAKEFNNQLTSLVADKGCANCNFRGIIKSPHKENESTSSELEARGALSFKSLFKNRAIGENVEALEKNPEQLKALEIKVASKLSAKDVGVPTRRACRKANLPSSFPNSPVHEHPHAPSFHCCCRNCRGCHIDHDKVQPFAQPEPVTVSEKVAIKYKPSLRIDTGCHSYPAVNAAGDISGGLKGTGDGDGDCTGSSLGSQVYGRAAWYSDLWAIMYAWYFPEDMPEALFKKGRRYDWVNIVVWLDNPAVENPKMIGVSPSSFANGSYSKYTPPPSDGLNGTSVMINYLADANNHGYHTVDTTWKDGGEFQDLIMWEQLTEEARTALSDADFGQDAMVPFIDANFEGNLKKSWPY